MKKKLTVFLLAVALTVSAYAGIGHFILGAGAGYMLSNHNQPQQVDCTGIANNAVSQYKQYLLLKFKNENKKKFTLDDINFIILSN